MTTLVHVNLGSNLKLLHEGACDEMKSVAEHSTLELTEKLQSKVHYTLSYIESEDKQVILREKGEVVCFRHNIDKISKSDMF